MNFISKIFRFFFRQLEFFCSFLRIIKLKLLYPGLNIDFKCFVEKNCKIVCVKGGKITLTNSTISYGTQIVCDCSAEIIIKDAFIGRNCIIVGKERIVIHSNCLIAEMVVIRDQDHNFNIDSFGKRIGFKTSPIEINESAWLAAKSTILKGVTVGCNSVLASSSVALQDIPPNEVWAGIPAKFIKCIKIN